MLRLFTRMTALLLILMSGLIASIWALAGHLNSPMLAFTSDRSGENYDIYLLDMPTNITARITRNGNTNSAPHWSPDGSTLSWLQGGSAASFYALTVPTYRAQPVTDLLVSSPVLAWAPSGQQFLFEKTAPNGWKNILLVNTADQSIRNLTEGDQLSESAPSWAPDGTRFAYSYQDNLANIRVAVYDLRDNSRTIITDEQSVFPSWSPDGETIAYLTRRGSIPRLTLIQPDGTDKRTIDLPLGQIPDYVPPQWSPDGRWLAFSVNASTVYLYDTATTALQALTPPTSFDYAPVWTDDSSALIVVETLPTRAQSRLVMIDIETRARTLLSSGGVFSTDRMPAWRGSS